QDRVIGLAAGVALALLGLRLRHGLDVSTEILPWHDLLDRFQRIAQSANRIQPALNIEKALLPHDLLAPSAHDRVRSPSQIRGDLARGIFRGALLSCERAVHPSTTALLRVLKPQKSIGLLPGFDIEIPFHHTPHAMDLAFAVAKKLATDLRIEDFAS